MTSPLALSTVIQISSLTTTTPEEFKSLKPQLQIAALSLKEKYLSLTLLKKIEICIQLLNCVIKIDEGCSSGNPLSRVLVFEKEDGIVFSEHVNPVKDEPDTRWTAPEIFWLAHKKLPLEENINKVEEWSRLNKSNVWGCAKTIACLLRPGMYHLLSPHRMDPKKEAQWYSDCYEKGFVPGMEFVGKFDPLCKLLKKMLAPCPQNRPSFQECLSRLERIRNAPCLFVITPICDNQTLSQSPVPDKSVPKERLASSGELVSF